MFLCTLTSRQPRFDKALRSRCRDFAANYQNEGISLSDSRCHFTGFFASWFVRMFLKFLRTASEAIVTIFHARPLFVSLHSSSFRMMLVLSFPPYVSTLCGVNLAFFCLPLPTFRVR